LKDLVDEEKRRAMREDVDGGVMPAEAQRDRGGEPQLRGPGLAGHVIEVALRVRVGKVRTVGNGKRANPARSAVSQGQNLLLDGR
jgi:hypothetical protein